MIVIVVLLTLAALNLVVGVYNIIADSLAVGVGNVLVAVLIALITAYVYDIRRNS